MESQISNSLKQIIENRLSYQTLFDREPPLKTGFSKLDAYLNGGITPGLIVLGAGPGLGKSTFCLQLAEQVSRTENIPVLYFSLEMTKERVAAKAITLDNFRTQKANGADVDGFPNGNAAKDVFFTAAELFNPADLKNMPPEKLQQFEDARNRVAQNDNLHIIDQPLCARKIVEAVKGFVGQPESQDGEPQPSKKPLVIIDYLQILPPDPDGRPPATDKQQVDLNLKILRELILKDIPVILISSLSRGSYSGEKTRSMKTDSFKETGGIEYSADVLLGLQFSACHNRDGCNPDEEKGKYPRNAEIIILKQRYGGADIKIPLRYYAEFDYMEEQSPEVAPAEEKTAEVKSQAAPAPQPTKEVSPAPAQKDSAPPQAKPEKTTPEPKPRKNEPLVYMNNTKIAYQIRNGQWTSGKAVRCNVASSGKKPVITEFILTGTLTSYDCDVADAVYSLYRSNLTGFTPRQVLHILSGDKNQTLTSQKKDEIANSLKRLMEAQITISCTEEMVEMRNKPELLTDDKVVFEGAFAQIQEKNGKYTFLKERGRDPMPLYSYGEYTKQMIAIPQKLLALRPTQGTKIPDTAENIIIKHYLIRRLEVIRKGRSSASHLLQVNYYSQTLKESSGLLNVLGIKRSDYTDTAWNKKIIQVEKAVLGILDCFKQRGYISGYEKQEHIGVTLPKQVKDPYKLSSKK